MKVTKRVEKDIDLYLKEIGIPFKGSGRIYIKESIIIILQNPSVKIKEAFAMIAERNNTSADKIYDCVKYTIKKARAEGGEDVLSPKRLVYGFMEWATVREKVN